MQEEQPTQGDFEYTFSNRPKERPKINSLGQFGILIGFTGVGILIGSLAGIVVWKLMTGASLLNIEKELLNPAYANAAKMMQLVITFFCFFLPAYFFTLIINRKPLHYLGFRMQMSSRQFFYLILIAFFGLAVSDALAELNQLIPVTKAMAVKFKAMEDDYNKEIMAMASMKSWGDYIFSLIVIALAPAIFEETLFRGALQQLFIKWFRNPWVGIIVTSILFSAVHWSYYGFLPRAVLGLVLGLIFYYGKNIWLNIFVHFLNNAIAVSALFFVSKNGNIPKEAIDGPAFPFWMGIIAAVLLIGVLVGFKRECDRMNFAVIDHPRE